MRRTVQAVCIEAYTCCTSAQVRQSNISSTPESTIMGNLLYLIAVVLVLAWLIGIFGFNAGNLVHILLVIAIIVVLLRVIQGRRPLG